MELTLQNGEVQLLARMLTSDLGDLRLEIGDTDDYDLRESLKKDEETLKSIIRRLDPQAAV